jgi:hypothetical protein
LVCYPEGRTENEKRVLRGIFGPNREEVTGGWRKLHKEEFPKLVL